MTQFVNGKLRGGKINKMFMTKFIDNFKWKLLLDVPYPYVQMTTNKAEGLLVFYYVGNYISETGP